MDLNLWNIIRDFFVQYVFGGITSTDELFAGLIGYTFTFNNGEYGGDNVAENTFSMFVKVPNTTNINYINENDILYLSLGDWLSTTATIITLIGLFIAITMFIIKLVKWISNAIALR